MGLGEGLDAGDDPGDGPDADDDEDENGGRSKKYAMRKYAPTNTTIPNPRRRRIDPASFEPPSGSIERLSRIRCD